MSSPIVIKPSSAIAAAICAVNKSFICHAVNHLIRKIQEENSEIKLQDLIDAWNDAVPEYPVSLLSASATSPGKKSGGKITGKCPAELKSKKGQICNANLRDGAEYCNRHKNYKPDEKPKKKGSKKGKSDDEKPKKKGSKKKDDSDVESESDSDDEKSEKKSPKKSEKKSPKKSEKKSSKKSDSESDSD